MKDLNIHIHPAEAAGTKPGIVCCANENRFEAAHYQEGVTQFIAAVLGTDLAPLQAELDLIAPPMRVGRRFEYKIGQAAITFLADQDDARAVGSAFTSIRDGRSSNTDKCVNRGLTTTLDRDEMLEGDIELNAKFLTAVLLRNSIIRAKVLIDAAATNLAKTWNASANPDGDVRDSLLLGQTARGVMPNFALYGRTAWAKRQAAYEASDKAGAFAGAGYTPEQLAGKLELDKVHVSDAVYRASKGGSLAMVFGATALMYYRDPIASKEDASNLKRFWSPCDGGEMVRVYVDESRAKTVYITVEHYSKEIVVDTTGVRKITVS